MNLACPAQAEGSAWRVSADFMHETRVELRRRLGADLYVLPQISAAGDQDSRPPVERAAEVRMARLAGHRGGGTAVWRQELAVRIADAVDRVLPLIASEIQWQPVLAHRKERLALPRRLLTQADVDQALREAEPHQQEYERLAAAIDAVPMDERDRRWYVEVSRAYRRSRRGAAVARRFEAQQRDATLPVEVHALRLGDVGMVTNPFELYLDYGMQIKGRSPAVQTFVVQLAGPGSYVPTARSIEGGAYGAVPASTEVGVEGGRALVEWSLNALTDLWRD